MPARLGWAPPKLPIELGIQLPPSANFQPNQKRRSAASPNAVPSSPPQISRFDTRLVDKAPLHFGNQVGCESRSRTRLMGHEDSHNRRSGLFCRRGGGEQNNGPTEMQRMLLVHTFLRVAKSLFQT